VIHAKQTSPQFPDPGKFSIIHEVGGLTTNIRTTLFGLCEKMLKGWAEGGATSQLLSKTDTTSLFRISYHIRADMQTISIRENGVILTVHRR